jgi:hypothetical protein
MKLKLAVAFAVLFFAGVVRADGVQAGGIGLTIPDGSTVTAVSVFTDTSLLPPNDMGEVSYSFADGTGVVEGNSWYGYTGTIDFTTPVSNVTLDWFDAEHFEIVSDSAGDFFDNQEANAGNSGVLTLPGSGITQINWFAGNEVGGVESISYTLDGTDPPGVPEPSSLLLSVVGLAALISLKLNA